MEPATRRDGPMTIHETLDAARQAVTPGIITIIEVRREDGSTGYVCSKASIRRINVATEGKGLPGVTMVREHERIDLASLPRTEDDVRADLADAWDRFSRCSERMDFAGRARAEKEAETLRAELAAMRAG